MCVCVCVYVWVRVYACVLVCVLGLSYPCTDGPRWGRPAPSSGTERETDETNTVQHWHRLALSLHFSTLKHANTPVVLYPGYNDTLPEGMRP